MPDTEVLDTTTTTETSEQPTTTLPDAKITGTLVENTEVKDSGTIQYTDGTILTYIRNAFDNTLPEVKKVLKTDKYKYESPFNIAKESGKLLDERCYVPGKLGDVLESEVLETMAAIMITYGPTENVEYEDTREAVEILVDDEGNIHGDTDAFNELRNSGYYVLQKPEDVLTPEVIEEYKATVKALTSTTISETKTDDDGFIVIEFTDGAHLKFTKSGELVEDTRSEDVAKPYESHGEALKKVIEDNLKDKEKEKTLVVNISESTEYPATKTFVFKYTDGSEVTVKNGRIIKDNRNINRKYQSIYNEMIYKYTELLDVGTDYFYEDPGMDEEAKRKLADRKIMCLPKSLVDKYITNRAMKNARIGIGKNSVNSLGVRTSTQDIMDALTAKKWDGKL